MALVFSLLYQAVIFFIFMSIQLPTAIFKTKNLPEKKTQTQRHHTKQANKQNSKIQTFKK